MSAQIAKLNAFLALIFPVAALVFPQSTWAASGNVQVCNPSASCTIGEFVYNDSYSPITTATCGITSRYPNGTLFLNNVNMPASSEGDGWYAHTFTAPTTLGLYRTEVKCTVGSDTMALDKSFEVQTASSTLTSNDVASAVWGYSGRSLTTFGTLIADIWNNATRTLTGAGLSSGSLATKSDVDSAKDDVKSKVSDVEKKVDDIKTTSTSTTTNVTNVTNVANNLLEQLINRSIIENVIEESSFTTTELQSKLEKSDSLANQLLTSGTYIKSKANLLKARWNNLGEAEITKSLDQMRSVIGEENDISDKNSIFGALNWITEQWNLPVSSKLYAQNKKLALSLKKVNSAQQLKGLSSDLDSFIKLVGSSDDSSKLNTLFGALQAKKELSSALDKNYFAATALLPNFGKDSKPSTDQIAQINVLGAQIAVVNQLPKMNKTILAKANTKMDQKQLKNKTLSLRGIVGANKQFLAQKPNEPLSSLWFEEGSIVFKTLISNPSKLISQKVPLKYYLPKEVTRENITKTDEELTVNYDTEKDQYYVSGNFTLAPLETKTLAVTVDDSAFHINDQEIVTMREQVKELLKPLNNTAYFAQGVILKTDMDVSLDKMDSLQKNNTTPEARIRSFREAQIEFKAAKEKLEKLKELATSAGSVGTLFGFVGGAQAIAVWGLIIIMAAGFVFLALYMRSLKMSEISYQLANGGQEQDVARERAAKASKKHTGENFENRSHVGSLWGRTIRLAGIILASGLFAGLVLSFVLSKMYGTAKLAQSNILGNQSEVPQGGDPSASPSTMSSGPNGSGQENSGKYEEVEIFVPEGSVVSIHALPSLNSEVLLSLSSSQEVALITTDNSWAKIRTGAGKVVVEGWVDEDFIERKESSPSGGIEPSGALVEIKDTPTGFLRVREAPWGQEITKVIPGEKFVLLAQSGQWSKISLDDGTIGWVYSSYTKLSEAAPVGGLY